tara:strand:- start:126 stop:806 length:681 start_codon:yes stop_codon:yes gene_type:complete
MIVAIIPARKNSKRIKNKNVKNFNKKPMIYWSIKKLKDSKIFDKIIVSSDSEKILKISRKLNVDICINRPKKLSTSTAITKDVIIHSINFLKKKNILPKFVFCVYPCAPFIKIEDLKKAIRIVKFKKDAFISTVTEYSHPIERSFSLTRNYRIIDRITKNINSNTQKFQKRFHDSGQFYLSTPKVWTQKNHPKNHYGIKLPTWRSIDIDSIEDWKRAELLSKIIKF